jgi:hypothetical protein
MREKIGEDPNPYLSNNNGSCVGELDSSRASILYLVCTIPDEEVMVTG